MSESAGGSATDRLVGCRAERLAGRWSARFIVAISVAYAAVMVAGFLSLGNLTDPLPDPYLAVAEVLILLLAPAMVVLMAAVHACAPAHLRMFGLIAFGWMLVAGGLTMTVHVVELVVARRVEPGAVSGFAQLFDFKWPSMLYAVDVVAWDLLLGLSLLFAAAVFTGHRYRAVRRGLLLSAVLCLAGLVGPATDVIAWRGIGILGYVVVFPVTCVGLSRAFAPPTKEPDMTQCPARWTRRPTGAELVRQVGAVVADLPRFLTAPLYRSRHLRWGATPEEVASGMPGDELLQSARFVCTRAVTIDAPPAAVWPWLVQVGYGRAGWYSNDLLDNLARPSAREIVAGLQYLEIGQRVPMAPGAPTETNAFRVEGFEVDRWLLWSKPDSTWVWKLTDLEVDGTRLVTRVQAVYDWRRPAKALVGMVLMEFGDFAMMRRMLLGIGERAELLYRRVPES